ncbi:MAG: GPW/gp25 family protein [bacterium]
MSIEFLGKGWKFPLELEESKIKEARYEQSIRDSIWIILSTARGERVMRPDFGCGIHNLVFALNDAETMGRIRNDVNDALLEFEPRIDVMNVDVSSGDSGNLFLIQIEYQVLTTNTRYNLVYPFYLDRSTS